MRRAAALLLLLCALTGSVTGLTIDPDRARTHAEAIRTTYPRPEASTGERALTDYIVSVLENSGLDYSQRDFASLTGGHSFSHILEVLIPGRSDQKITIAVPLNHSESAGPDEDGSPSLAAALAALEAAAVAPLPMAIQVVFLGAEYGDQAAYPMGTRLFLTDYFPESAQFVVYLDVSNKDVVIETGARGAVTPSWLLSSCVEAGQLSGLNLDVRSSLNQLHRLGVSDAPRALGEFLAAGIPTVYLASSRSALSVEPVADTAARLAAMLSMITDSFEAGIPAEWDRHYLYFQIGERQLVIGETLYIQILLAVIFGTLLYSVVFRKRLMRYVRTMFRNSWNLPALFVLVFAFLAAGTLLIDLLLLLRRIPTVWEFEPLAYLSLKIVLSMLLFTIAARLLRRLPLSKNGSFYSAAALLVLFVDILVFAYVDVALSYYFVWSFLCAFVFSVVRARWLKLLTLLAAPLFLIIVAVEILTAPVLRVSELLLSSVQGNLVLSFITLPFLLMLVRLDFLVRHPVRGRRAFALTIATGTLVAVSVGILVYILVSYPFSTANPQPIAATETIDYTESRRGLELSSPAPLGEVTILFDGETRAIDTRARDWSTTSDSLPDALTVRLAFEEFLDRDRAVLTVDAPAPVEDLFIHFDSDDPMVIYDVDYPFTISPDRMRADIYIGRRPPLPLVVNYTIGRNTQPRVTVETVSRYHPEPLAITRNQAEISTRLVVRTRIGS